MRWFLHEQFSVMFNIVLLSMLKSWCTLPCIPCLCNCRLRPPKIGWLSQLPWSPHPDCHLMLSLCVINGGNDPACPCHAPCLPLLQCIWHSLLRPSPKKTRLIVTCGCSPCAYPTSWKWGQQRSSRSCHLDCCMHSPSIVYAYHLHLVDCCVPSYWVALCHSIFPRSCRHHYQVS